METLKTALQVRDTVSKLNLLEETLGLAKDNLVLCERGKRMAVGAALRQPEDSEEVDRLIAEAATFGAEAERSKRKIPRIEREIDDQKTFQRSLLESFEQSQQERRGLSGFFQNWLFKTLTTSSSRQD